MHLESCLLYTSDVFTETIPSNERIATFYNDNREDIYNLGYTPEAVSYTHLDVYKRQMLRGWGRFMSS